MGLFDTINGPQILRKSNKAKEQLAAMESLLASAKHPKLISVLENDIAAMKAGIFGEDTILFELKNCPIPLIVLHDLYLEYEDLSAQIDFMVVTKKRIFVLECKNLYGNLTVNQSGEFIRTIGSRREGIYSPVTQSQRHLDLLKRMRVNGAANILARMLIESGFSSNYKSVVVLANPKTVLNAKYAPKEIREQVIRADGLIEYIKQSNAQKDAPDGTENQMIDLAYYFLRKHVEPKMDYLEKYRRMAEELEGGVEGANEETPVKIATISTLPHPSNTVKQQELPQDGIPKCPVCGSVMVKRKAGKGANEGNEFWGCPKFPKCRGTVKI